jgi:hypothetical protein
MSSPVNSSADKSLSTKRPNWLDVLSIFGNDLQTICIDITRDTIIPARDLQRCLYLHLPRFTPEQLVDRRTLLNDAERLLQIMIDNREPCLNLTSQDKLLDFRKEDIIFNEVNNELAQTIYANFHYLGTGREGIAHLGLYHKRVPEIPMALMTLSEMDIQHLKYELSDKQNQVLVVSRSFAFDWAPRNSISFLTSQIRSWIKQRRSTVAMLLTYINPNLGFTGASYAASGWHLYGRKDIFYRYLHDRYLTYRTTTQLSDNEKLEIRKSYITLAPLNILTIGVAHNARLGMTRAID